MPAGFEPAATASGCLGVSAPAADTSYCETVPSVKFVTYALEPSGLRATWIGPAPVAAVEAKLSAPAESTS